MIKFSKEECLSIINLSKTLEGTDRDESPRPIKYTFYSVEYNDEHKWIFERLNKYFTFNTGIEVVANLDTIHLFIYGPGNKFVKHRDIYHENQVYNIGASLNSDFEGGEFKLYNPDIILPKQTGNVYTFSCTREHEVLEVTKGNRWSIIGFYHYEHLNMKRSLV